MFSLFVGSRFSIRQAKCKRPANYVVAFVELRAVPAVPDAALELRLPGDRQLLIRPGCDSTLLGQVLSALSGVGNSSIPQEGRSC